MENINFWFILIGLIANLIVTFLAIIYSKTPDTIFYINKFPITINYSTIIRIISFLLAILIIVFFILFSNSESQKIDNIKEEIVSIIVTRKNSRFNNTTLSEIIKHLQRVYPEENAYYSKALTLLVKEKVIEENTYSFHTAIQTHDCYIYNLSK